MYIRRVIINHEEKPFVPKDNLNRIPSIVMRILLFLSFVFYEFHTTEFIVNSIPYFGASLDINYTVVLVIGQILTAGVNLLVFELVGNFYYGFIRPACSQFINQKGFMEYLRASYVIRNILGGVIKFIFYKSDILVYGFNMAINLLVTVIVLSATCIYVMVKYVPNRARAVFLKCVSIPFIVFEVLTVGVSLL